MANVNQQDRAVGAQASQFLPSVNPFLGLLPREYWNKVKDFFAYGSDFAPINAGQTLTVTEQIQADSDFLLVAINRVVTATDNTTVKDFAPMLVRLEDSGSGRNLTDQPIHLENIAGTAQLPAILPFPKVLLAGSSFSIQLQNLDAANNFNVRLALLGFKIFPQVQR